MPDFSSYERSSTIHNRNSAGVNSFIKIDTSIMIPLISIAITHHFKEDALVELRFNHASSNAYRTTVYDALVGGTVVLSSLRIPDMILDFRKESNWSDERIQAEMTTILIGYITQAMNSSATPAQMVDN